VSDDRFTLSRLPLPARLVLAAFLLSVALGYTAALAEVHFQMAAPGELLPGPAEIEAYYAGPREPRSTLVRLLETESGPLNAAGTMRRAFTHHSRGWDRLTEGLSAEQLARLRQEREGERLALLAWARGGADRAAYEHDDFPLGPDLAPQPITPDLRLGDASGRVRLRTLIGRRCTYCHAEDGRIERARMFPLDSYERLRPYVEAPPSRQLTLPKLAQTTHAHLLGLGLLYGATGLVFAFTRYPAAVRVAFGLLPLLGQVGSVACGWLARVGPGWAWGVTVLGPLIGLGLAVQVLGSGWDLFGGSLGKNRACVIPLTEPPRGSK
jgi:hypothetical protein